MIYVEYYTLIVIVENLNLLELMFFYSYFQRNMDYYMALAIYMYIFINL